MLLDLVEENILEVHRCRQSSQVCVVSLLLSVLYCWKFWKVLRFASVLFPYLSAAYPNQEIRKPEANLKKKKLMYGASTWFRAQFCVAFFMLLDLAVIVLYGYVSFLSLHSPSRIFSVAFLLAPFFVKLCLYYILLWAWFCFFFMQFTNYPSMDSGSLLVTIETWWGPFILVNVTEKVMSFLIILRLLVVCETVAMTLTWDNSEMSHFFSISPFALGMWICL